MPGLLNKTAGAPGSSPQAGTGLPAATAGAAAGAAGAAAPGEEQPNVSPEEQAQYDQFVDQALSVMYDKKSMPQVVKSLEGDGNPLDGLANTAVIITKRVEDAAEKAGQPVGPDVVFHAGAEILEGLVELAEAAGVHKYTPEEIEGASFKAMDIYREMNGVDGGQNRPQLVNDFNEIVALDQAGRLDELAPGLSQKYPPQGGGQGRR